MSTIEVLKVYHPLLDQPERSFLCPIGPASSNYQVIKSINASTSQAVWSTITPGVSCGVNRKWWQRFRIRVTYPDAGADPALIARLPLVTQLFTNPDFGLRQLPIASCTETATLKLNGSSNSISLSEIVHAIAKHGIDEDVREYGIGLCPAYPDQYPEYVVPPGTTNSFDPANANRNPFANYGDNVADVTRVLALYVKDAVTKVDAGNVVHVQSFDIELVEPLLIPPLIYGREDHFALYGIQTIDLMEVFGDLKRIFSGTHPTVAGGYGLDVATVSFYEQPELLLNYITPPADFEVPAYCTYPFSEVNIQKNPTVALAANLKNMNPWYRDPATPLQPYTPASARASSNSISFTCVPDRIYTFLADASRTTAVAKWEAPDTFALIQNYNGRFETRSGILSEASPEMLYYLSQRNGVEQTWQQWSRFQGSVLCLAFGLDIPLPLLVSTGSRGSWQYQHDLTVVNSRATAVTYTHFLVWIASGVFSVNDSVCSQSVGFITQQALLDASFAAPGSFNELMAMNGGLNFRGFLKDAWRGMKNVGRVVRDVAKKAADIAGPVAQSLAQSGALGPMGTNIASKVAEYAPMVSGVAQSLGAGRRKRGGAMVGGALSGGAMVGGQAVSHRTLSARARR